jgi:hypothetical protein
MTVEKGGTTKHGEGSYINMTKMKSGFFSFDLEEVQGQPRPMHRLLVTM